MKCVCDGLSKLRAAPWEYAYMVRAAALRGPKMAQDLVPCQRLLYCGSGYRQAVQIAVPGFMIGVRLLGGVAQRAERSSCLHFMARGTTN
jgi:hypothetical protein